MKEAELLDVFETKFTKYLEAKEKSFKTESNPNLKNFLFDTLNEWERLLKEIHAENNGKIIKEKTYSENISTLLYMKFATFNLYSKYSNRLAKIIIEDCKK